MPRFLLLIYSKIFSRIEFKRKIKQKTTLGGIDIVKAIIKNYTSFKST